MAGDIAARIACKTATELLSGEIKVMTNTMKCPKCGTEATMFGSVSCWCDKDFCSGQRCGADDLFSDYSCPNGHSGTPPDTMAYYNRHSEE